MKTDQFLISVNCKIVIHAAGIINISHLCSWFLELVGNFSTFLEGRGSENTSMAEPNLFVGKDQIQQVSCFNFFFFLGFQSCPVLT